MMPCETQYRAPLLRCMASASITSIINVLRANNPGSTKTYKHHLNKWWCKCDKSKKKRQEISCPNWGPNKVASQCLNTNVYVYSSWLEDFIYFFFLLWDAILATRSQKSKMAAHANEGFHLSHTSNRKTPTFNQSVVDPRHQQAILLHEAAIHWILLSLVERCIENHSRSA